MIDRKHRLSVTRQATLLGLSRGSVYYLPQPTSAADLALMRRLDELHLEHPFMGARMLRRQLLAEGIRVGRRHVRTLMRRMGMEALCPQPGTSQRHPDYKIYPYLLRQLAITRANQVWALDTTYIPMARGFVYLTAVVDVASRLVLAHKVAITLEACHAKEIIEQAFARYGVPAIVNTDQGSQRSGFAILNSAISGNSGQNAWPRQAGQEGVFDGQEIRAADTPHAHGGVQGARSVGGVARGSDAGRAGRRSLRFTPTRLRTGSGNCSSALLRFSGPRSRRPLIWLRYMPRSGSRRWSWIF